MVYRATQDVVRRVMPLLDRLASRTIDKARLLQYLSARAGEEWGVLDLVEEIGPDPERAGGAGVKVGRDAVTSAAARQLVFQDRISGKRHMIVYPDCLTILPERMERLVRAEYRRLAMDRPLTSMDPDLFAYFYQATNCDRCRWRGPEYAQFHRECHFVGHPVNYEDDGRDVGDGARV